MLEEDDPLTFEVLDILSLKLKRMIAVSWPYEGLLGRIGLYFGKRILDLMGTICYMLIQTASDDWNFQRYYKS